MLFFQKISEEFKKMKEYLEIAERCYCATCVANLDHQIPVLSLTGEKCGKRDKKEGFLDSVVECPPVDGNIIGRIEYQTVFLMVIKKEQEFYFKTQIEAINNKKELPHSDILANVAPFIDDKTGLLKSRGRIGYEMKPHRDEEFLQQHTEHYNIILPSRGSFVKAYLLDVHQKFNCASERFVNIVRQERFHMTSPVRVGKSAIHRCMKCITRRSLQFKLSTPVGNIPSFRIPSGMDPRHNKPWRTIMFDLKGPVSVVNDTFKLKNSKKERKGNKMGNEENLSKVERIKI